MPTISPMAPTPPSRIASLAACTRCPKVRAQRRTEASGCQGVVARLAWQGQCLRGFGDTDDTPEHRRAPTSRTSRSTSSRSPWPLALRGSAGRDSGVSSPNRSIIRCLVPLSSLPSTVVELSGPFPLATSPDPPLAPAPPPPPLHRSAVRSGALASLANRPRGPWPRGLPSRRSPGCMAPAGGLEGGAPGDSALGGATLAAFAALSGEAATALPVCAPSGVAPALCCWAASGGVLGADGAPSNHRLMPGMRRSPKVNLCGEACGAREHVSLESTHCVARGRAWSPSCGVARSTVSRLPPRRGQPLTLGVRLSIEATLSHGPRTASSLTLATCAAGVT